MRPTDLQMTRQCAQRHDRGKKKEIILVCLSPEGIACYSTLEATLDSFPELKSVALKLKFMVYRLVTARKTPCAHTSSPLALPD